MRLQFGLTSYERAKGDLPELPVVNMFAEEAPSEETGVALQSRYGLTDQSADIGTSVKAIFQRDRVLSGAQFAVSSGALYSGVTNLGAIDGSGAASIAGLETDIFVTQGASLYTYEGATLSAVSFPDAANVTKVVAGASRAIALRADGGKFYWTPALGNTFAALDFATAESQPDGVLDALFIDDVLVLFGSETVEFWPNTGNSDLPFQPLEGRVFERGIRATGCATIMGATFYWVGDDNALYTNGNEPTRISNAGLEEAISGSTACSLFTFTLEGTEFLALRLDTETHVYSSRSRMFSRFESYGQTNWLPTCYASGIFGASDGKQLAWSTDHLDVGGQLERRWRAGMAINGGGVQVSNVQLRTNPGQTSYLAGQYADPTIEMRVSRNAGQSWKNWKSRSLGAQGEYRKKVQWRGCGQASQPGFLCEFRTTDPVPLRISDVRINEPYGGR